jgi:flavin-dependent dehydrogenase
MAQTSEQYDCVVIGGGPAGATTAALVADAGFRTLLLEREAVARRRVGESLMPETYWTFERLGILDQLRKSAFPRKVGVQFVSSSGTESQPFLFRTHDPRECSRTWHVERANFDPLLIECARDKGAEIRRGMRVREVLFDGNRAVGVRVMATEQDAVAANESRDEVIQAKVVVDASGQQSVLANRFGLRRMNAEFRKAAIWGHFRGARREIIEEGVMTLILRSQSNNCWFWHIPLSNDVVSIGLVGDAAELLRERGTPEQVFDAEVANCPGIAERLAGAERVAGLDVVKEFSYTTDRSAGDGWVSVGDAWGFIDPIYSSGVWFALKSGELAADAVIEGLRDGDTSGAQLGKWVPDFNRSTNWIRKLVRAFYSGQFRVGQFVKEYPQHHENLVDLLIGRVFHPDAGRIFDDLDPWLKRMKLAGVTS